MAGPLPLSALLSKALVAFTIEFDNEFEHRTPHRTTNHASTGEGAAVGVSKEAIAMAVKRLEEGRFAVVQGRVTMFLLTIKGQRARNTYNRLVWGIEKRWEASFGAVVGNLRRLLEPLAYPLHHHPDAWRAAVRKPEVLPNYPMILHRDGFPDGG